MKTCASCGELQDTEEFIKKDGTEGGICQECLMMFALARAKLEHGYGSGSIKTKTEGGDYLDLDPMQEWHAIADGVTPSVTWMGENKHGELVELTDTDLLHRSLARINHTFVRRGFVDIPYQDREDAAAEVVVEFLERMQDTTKDGIDDPNAYLWALCSAKAKQRMMEFVQRRKDLAAPIDEMMANGWDVEEVEVDPAEPKPKMYERLTRESLAEIMPNTTDAERTALRNAILDTTKSKGGDNKGMAGRSRAKLVSIREKVSPETIRKLKELVNG